jgi:hypothetical protein
MPPAGVPRHPEDVLGQVFLGILGVGVELAFERGVLGLESVRDVLEEDQAEAMCL